MNCKQGDQAMAVWAFKPDGHYDELLGKVIKCDELVPVIVNSYEQLGPFSIVSHKHYPMWLLPKIHTCKCGCELIAIPDAMLQPLPEVKDDAETQNETSKELDTVL